MEAIIPLSKFVSLKCAVNWQNLILWLLLFFLRVSTNQLYLDFQWHLLSLVTLHIVKVRAVNKDIQCQAIVSCITWNLECKVPQSCARSSLCYHHLLVCAPALGVRPWHWPPWQAALKVAFYQSPASDLRSLGSAAGVSSQDGNHDND